MNGMSYTFDFLVEHDFRQSNLMSNILLKHALISPIPVLHSEGHPGSGMFTLVNKYLENVSWSLVVSTAAYTYRPYIFYIDLFLSDLSEYPLSRGL